jgi:hypothetical protein
MSDQNPDRPQPALPYRAYLVRLWREGSEAVWRASAQSVQTGEIVRFANLDALFAFLESRTTNKIEKETD